MNRKQLMRRMALGTVAGIAGTFSVQGLRIDSQKWLITSTLTALHGSS